MKKIFDKINSRFEVLPIASGPNVFKVNEYAESIGLKYSAARNRLQKLTKDGVLRRVRIPGPAGPREGYEYIAKD